MQAELMFALAVIFIPIFKEMKIWQEERNTRNYQTDTDQ